jgi:surface protein
MFGSTSAFNQPIGTWNTSAVTNMSQMFELATAFNQTITWITGLTSQPVSFSTGANAAWIADRNTKFPFLSNGTTRIST